MKSDKDSDVLVKMTCPSCDAIMPLEARECPRCGLIPAKFAAYQARKAETAPAKPKQRKIFSDPKANAAINAALEELTPERRAQRAQEEAERKASVIPLLEAIKKRQDPVARDDERKLVYPHATNLMGMLRWWRIAVAICGTLGAIASVIEARTIYSLLMWGAVLGSLGTASVLWWTIRFAEEILRIGTDISIELTRQGVERHHS